MVIFPLNTVLPNKLPSSMPAPLVLVICPVLFRVPIEGIETSAPLAEIWIALPPLELMLPALLSVVMVAIELARLIADAELLMVPVLVLVSVVIVPEFEIDPVMVLELVMVSIEPLFEIAVYPEMVPVLLMVVIEEPELLDLMPTPPEPVPPSIVPALVMVPMVPN